MARLPEEMVERITQAIRAAGYEPAAADAAPDTEQSRQERELRALRRDLLFAAAFTVPLVLISAEIAQRLPPDQLDACLARITPPVVIVPDVRGYTPVPDLATRLRRQLGVLE